MGVKYVKIGKLTSGKNAIVRTELISSGALPLAFELVKEETGFDLWERIIQAKGGSILSAGTHTDGAALDIRVWYMTLHVRLKIVKIFRECGFSATWHRDWAGNEHIHVGADIRPTWSRVTYQCNAVRAGYDGLGKGGRGGRDPDPKPSHWKTVWQGATWGKAQLINNADSEEEILMALKPETVEQIVKAIFAQKFTANGKTTSFAQHSATSWVDDKAQSAALARIAAKQSQTIANQAVIIKALRAQGGKL